MRSYHGGKKTQCSCGIHGSMCWAWNVHYNARSNLELNKCVSPEFRAIDPPNPFQKFIQQNERRRLALAAHKTYLFGRPPNSRRTKSIIIFFSLLQFWHNCWSACKRNWLFLKLELGNVMSSNFVKRQVMYRNHCQWYCSLVRNAYNACWTVGLFEFLDHTDESNLEEFASWETFGVASCGCAGCRMATHRPAHL